MNGNDLKKYADHALERGTTSVKQIHPSSVVTAAWVRLKFQTEPRNTFCLMLVD
jgi:hypothetical protein